VVSNTEDDVPRPQEPDFLDELVDDSTALDAGFPALYQAARERRAFIRQLAATRVAAGLSQSEVARRMGVLPSVVSRFESGSDPRHSTEDRYAAAVGGRVLRSIVMDEASLDT
jgi:hypothetical protein